MASNDAQSGTSEAAIANPAPLGLCGFAMTTFVLSAANAHMFSGATVFLGLAFFYGGLAQLLAGMWEFKTGNTFGATAFTSYGAFWLALASTIQFHFLSTNATVAGHSVGVFLLAWTLFTGIMLLASLRTNAALILLFAFLFVTFVLLTLAKFGNDTEVLGGYFGLATAFIAWYCAAAGLLVATKSKIHLPVGPIA